MSRFEKFAVALAVYLTIAPLAVAVDIADLNVRDPFVLYDAPADTYYLYRSHSSGVTGGVEVYMSRDLREWSDPVQVMDVPADNWATGGIWAPEVHAVDGKYYMFATVNEPVVWKNLDDGRKYEHRGTQIFVADAPVGPFMALYDRLPATPVGEMCLDGTFYRDGERNYMVYCHEWVELTDGTVEMVELDGNMRPMSQPVRLFCGSSADWSTGFDGADGRKCYVTDGVFLYRSPETGHLYMIWSSFSHGNYAIGVARSKTGRITGPWIQDPEPLFDRDGGHGMMFTDRDGTLRLVIHGPNSPGGAERAMLFPVYETGNTLRLKR